MFCIGTYMLQDVLMRFDNDNIDRPSGFVSPSRETFGHDGVLVLHRRQSISNVQGVCELKQLT